jgi:hypothetical protein
MAMYCQDNINTAIDVSQTCFKLGWDHRSLILVDHLELRDSETGELCNGVSSGGRGDGRAARCNAAAPIN